MKNIIFALIILIGAFAIPEVHADTGAIDDCLGTKGQFTIPSCKIDVPVSESSKLQSAQEVVDSPHAC